MPFSVGEFFSVFSRYNEAIWPLQLVAYIAGIAIIGFLLLGTRRASVVIASLLAFLWAVNGVGYHWMFFSKINPAARVFGAIFVLQALLLAASPWIFPHGVWFAKRADARSVCGLALMGFAAVVYPIWGQLSGHHYPAAPVFGVAPCPTTIFTIGVLLMGNWSSTKWMLIVPAVWAAIGGSGAFLLRVPQDAGLLASGAVLLFFYAARWRKMPIAEHITAR